MGVAVYVLVGEGVSDAVRVRVGVGVSVPAAAPTNRCGAVEVGDVVRVRVVVAVAVTGGVLCWIKTRAAISGGTVRDTVSWYDAGGRVP